MTEPELEPGYDPETFNEGLETGYDIASSETQEQMAELLEDAGFDEDEIEEALYDPAPRKGHKAHRRKHHRRSSRRAFDPTPTKRRRRTGRKGVKKGRKGKKSKLAKFRKFAMPAAALGSFYMSYSANAKARNMSIIDALKYDLANWNAEKTYTKISTNPYPVAGAIGIPLVRGYIPGANTGIVGLGIDIIHGIMIGQAATQIIDEPAPVRSSARVAETIRPQQVITAQTAPAPQPQPQQMNAPAFRNPYGGY